MRYLGGKSKHAKEIAKIINPRGVWWDPFCGGFAVSEALMRYGPGVASDAHPALISMYQAIQGGWNPPRSMSAEEYARARTLPDSDPLKAFAGFGCSFGGLWFQSQARDSTGKRNYARESADGLIRDVRGAPVQFLHLNFLDIEPIPGVTLYLDPPYAGTTGYTTGAFDHDRFWSLAQRWALLGPVFVSEYACPVPHRLVWSKSTTSALQGGAKANARLEKLFALHSPDVDDSRPHQDDREGASAR
jgi:DNA adenine methylase